MKKVYITYSWIIEEKKINERKVDFLKKYECIIAKYMSLFRFFINL